MKLKFSIAYSAAWGEAVHVDIRYISDGSVIGRTDLPLTTSDGLTWSGVADFRVQRQKPPKAILYYYKVSDGSGKELRREYDSVGRLIPCNPAHDYTFLDGWRERPMMSHLFSGACQTASFGDANKRNGRKAEEPIALFSHTALFRISAPQIEEGQSVAILGSHPSLGSWDERRYAKMEYIGDSIWLISLNVEAITDKLEYKYVVVDDSTNKLTEWEGGFNRELSFSGIRSHEVVVADGGYLRVKESMWKAAGVAIPVFSLRSEHSYGIGDFGDLKLLADWASVTGMRIIQILPVNDTTMQHNWSDSFPYNAISVNALHPQYIDLEAAGKIEDPDIRKAFRRRRQELNSLSTADYMAVERVKGEYMRLLFTQEKEKIMRDKQFRNFVKDNAEWLFPYAAFCLLRDSYGTARFTDWHEFATYDIKNIIHYLKKNFEEAALICYKQYVLHSQLLEASLYAKSKGIALMGDIPVGISHDSVEAWAEGKYFCLNSQTGSPPDSHNPLGQNWCFPTYNWDEMAADGYKWWKERLRRMERYFGAVRIDHILGFFRIWEIPESSVDGTLGHFSPSLPYSLEEIGQSGFTFHKQLYTEPFINDKIISKLFGIHSQYVKDSFLYPKGYKLYGLKSEYETQKKIRNFFGDCRDENGRWIRDGLYRLASSVLFIEDERRPGFYHPRIRAFEQPVFAAMNQDDRLAFMNLYNEYFYNRHAELWGSVAFARLSALLSATRMLPCGEDLGQLPDCVAPVLESLRILTLEIQTLPKERDLEIAHLEANPYLSVATISTHDMPPLRLWWEEERQKAQTYYEQILQRDGKAPEKLSAMLAGEIVARHLYCPSMLCMLALQDWLSIDDGVRAQDARAERINIPGDSFNRWQYRMHINLENLIKEDKLNNKIKSMIKGSKRC